jgi:hypothetical protein
MEQIEIQELMDALDHVILSYKPGCTVTNIWE